MQNSTIKKSLVCLVIILFIGIAVAPSVTSIDISKSKSSNNDLVEITLQLCKTSGIEDHKMYITEEQDEQLDNLIESFKEDLENSESYDETVRIYNNMVVSLDELGILPESTNCKEVQELVTGENSISNPEMKSMKHFNQDDNENKNCLISGETTNTVVDPFLGSIFLYSLILRFVSIEEIWKMFDQNILLEIWAFSLLSRLSILFQLCKVIDFFPLKVGGLMTFGRIIWDPWEPDFHPAEGWVYTNGLNGIKRWTDYIYGDILELPIFIESNYIGAFGFTGIKILIFGTSFYLGYALRVKLTNNSPWP